MENNSQNQFVEEGKLMSEVSYSRRSQKWRELSLPGIKIDHFDPHTNTVKEVKKSAKLEKAHIAQVQYYLYRVEEAGVKDPKGLLEYPKMRKVVDVPWNAELRMQVKMWLGDIVRIISAHTCPDVINKPYCRACAFRDFCYV